MVDAVDSKSAVSNGVGVQVPPGVQKGGSSEPPFLFCVGCLDDICLLECVGNKLNIGFLSFANRMS